MSENLSYEGFEYVKNGKYKERLYYRCVKYQSQSCCARLVRIGEVVIVKGVHACQKVTANCDDITSFIDEYIRNAAQNLSITPEQIFEDLIIDINKKFKGSAFHLPSKSSVKSSIHSIRGSSFVDMTKIETVPFSCTTLGKPFIRRHWFGDFEGQYHRIIIWASDFSIALLRHEGQIFIDGTFRVVPNNFSQ